MPQLQVDFFFSEFLWLFIFFTLTYTFLKYTFLPQILSLYKAREYVLMKLDSNAKLLRNQQNYFKQYLYLFTLRVYKVLLTEGSFKDGK